MLKKIIVPNWFYDDGCSCYRDGNRTASCRQHDFEYWLGGKLIDKEKADQNLFFNIEKLEGVLNQWFHCWVMYIGVKTWGRKPFEEREERLNENDPDIEKLYIAERPKDYLKQINRICERQGI